MIDFEEKAECGESRHGNSILVQAQLGGQGVSVQ